MGSGPDSTPYASVTDEALLQELFLKLTDAASSSTSATSWLVPESISSFKLYHNTTRALLKNGYALHYSHEYMLQHSVMTIKETKDKDVATGKPTSVIKVRDYSVIKAMVEDLARGLGDTEIHVWQPAQFGESESDMDDWSVLQRVLPLRSGLQGVRCESAVWRIEVGEGGVKEDWVGGGEL